MTHHNSRDEDIMPISDVTRDTVKCEQEHMRLEEMQRHLTMKRTPSEMDKFRHNHSLNESADSPWAPMTDILGDVKEKNVDVDSFTFTAQQSTPHATTQNKGGSVFAREMNARLGSLQASNVDDAAPCGSSGDAMAEGGEEEVRKMKTAVSRENDQLLANMTEEEIMQERAMLLSKLDPKLVAYLQKKGTFTTPPSTVAKSGTGDASDAAADPNIAELEIIHAPKGGKEENYALLDAAGRVATDPTAYDLVDKCQSLMGKNRVRAIQRLFDTVQVECGGPDPRSPHSATSVHDHVGFSLHAIRKSATHPTELRHSTIGRDELCKIAAYNMYRIRLLYCAHSAGKTEEWTLRDGISPDTDPVWFLAPIIARATEEFDEETLIARYTNCLLFTHALIGARPEYLALPSIFTHVFAMMARLIIKGDAVMDDALIVNLLLSIFEEYIVRQMCCPTLLGGIRQHFHADTPIDAFGTLIQLYTRLLHCTISSPTLLSPAMALMPMFASDDSKMAHVLWHTDHATIVRMITWKKEEEAPIPCSMLTPSLTTDCTNTSLLLAYACALTTKTILPQRNALLHAWLVEWIGAALRRDASFADDDKERMDGRVRATLQHAIQ